jgi:hypothetical protein
MNSIKYITIILVGLIILSGCVSSTENLNYSKTDNSSFKLNEITYKNSKEFDLNDLSFILHKTTFHKIVTPFVFYTIYKEDKEDIKVTGYSTENNLKFIMKDFNSGSCNVKQIKNLKFFECNFFCNKKNYVIELNKKSYKKIQGWTDDDMYKEVIRLVTDKKTFYALLNYYSKEKVIEEYSFDTNSKIDNFIYTIFEDTRSFSGDYNTKKGRLVDKYIYKLTKDKKNICSYDDGFDIEGFNQNGINKFTNKAYDKSGNDMHGNFIYKKENKELIKHECNKLGKSWQFGINGIVYCNHATTLDKY